MKAYKASYNGVCRGFKYEVGKTYETDNIEICYRGFHACRKMMDTLNYYPYNIEFVLFEVELLGEVIERGDKLVTNKIKIVRIVPPEEYLNFKGDDRGNLLYIKYVDKHEYWYEYDINNNCIYSRNSGGVEWWKKFDQRNKCIHYKESNGYEWNCV